LGLLVLLWSVSAAETSNEKELKSIGSNADHLSRPMREAKDLREKNKKKKPNATIGKKKKGKREGKRKSMEKGKKGINRRRKSGVRQKKGRKGRKGKGKKSRVRKNRKGKNKKKKQTGKGRRRKSGKRRSSKTQPKTTTKCSNITCLNNLLQVLKIDRDTVQNFISQKKRIEKRMKLIVSKSGKSNKTAESLNHLVLALGGRSSLKNNTPVCGGRWNNSDAQKGFQLWKNMTPCAANIVDNCNFTLSDSEQSKMDSCIKVMENFKIIAADCSANHTTDCSCWSEAAKQVQEVKDCNKANSLSTKDKEVKSKTKKCTNQFIECKKYEDETIQYIASCKTSGSALQTTLTNLYTAQNRVTSVLNKTAAVATKGNSSTSSSRLTQSTVVSITYTTITVSSDTSSFTNASHYMNAMAMFTDVAQKLDTDAIGTDSSISYLATRIASTNTISLSFSTTHITLSTTFTSVLTSVSNTINTRITQVQSMLTGITGTTKNPADISVSTVEVQEEEGERPSTAEKPDDLQAANFVLLQNKVAIDGILLAIDAAISSTASNFKSELGLKPKTILGLIEGFDASLVRTLYSSSGYEMAKSIILIFSNKKIQTLTASDITSIKSMRTLLTTVLKVQISTEITTVQAAITSAGGTVEKTEADIEKFTFPLAEAAGSTDTTITEVQRLTIVLKALIANKDGLEKTLTAVNTAISSTSTTGKSGAKVIQFVHSVEAMAASLYGADLEKTIIQSVALDVVKITMVTASAKLTATEKSTLETSITELQAAIVSVTKEILVTQSSLTMLTGVTINLSTLTVNLIDVTKGTIVETVSSTTVSQPTTDKEKEASVTALKATLSSITSVITIIEKVQKGELTEGTETSASVFLSNIVLILTNSLMGIFGTSFDVAVTTITSVTKVSFATMTTAQTTLLIEIVSALQSFTGTASGSMNEAVASLVSSAGLVVASISDDLTDDEKVAAADKQLETNRANCGGMDDVASSLETLISASSTVQYVCADKFDADCSTIPDNSNELITLLFKLSQLSSGDLEDVTISSTSATVVTLISKVTIISMEQKATIMSCISSFRFTVFVYVSQISIIESKKLDIAGALKFPGATASIFDVEDSDEATQKTVLEFQLTNLFQLDNANDGVISCITTLEGLPAASDPKPNPALQSEVNKVPAMCGAPEPPVSEVQTTAASIVKTCASVTQQPTQAELKTLIFIKQSLITFKQTFITQITIFSNKMTALTDVTVTAASLAVSLISSTGEIAVAEAVDITGGTTAGSLEFYILRFEVMFGSLSAIQEVLAKLTKVLAFTTTEAAGSVVGINFALLISQLTASLSSGVITTDILSISQSILKFDITALPSPAIVNLLQSALFSAQSLQITILAQMTLIQLKISSLAGTSISSSSFTMQEISSTGVISQFTVPALTVSQSSSQAELSSAISAYQSSRTILLSVKTQVLATFTLSFQSTSVTTVTISQFLVQVSSFMVELGTNVLSTNVQTLSETLLKLKINVGLSQTIKSKVNFILYLIRICDMMLLDIIKIITEISGGTITSVPTSSGTNAPSSTTPKTTANTDTTKATATTTAKATTTAAKETTITGTSTATTTAATTPATTTPATTTPATTGTTTTSFSTSTRRTTPHNTLTTKRPGPTTTRPTGPITTGHSGHRRSARNPRVIWNRIRGTTRQ